MPNLDHNLPHATERDHEVLLWKVKSVSLRDFHVSLSEC